MLIGLYSIPKKYAVFPTAPFSVFFHCSTVNNRNPVLISSYEYYLQRLDHKVDRLEMFTQHCMNTAHDIPRPRVLGAGSSAGRDYRKFVAKIETIFLTQHHLEIM